MLGSSNKTRTWAHLPKIDEWFCQVFSLTINGLLAPVFILGNIHDYFNMFFGDECVRYLLLGGFKDFHGLEVNGTVTNDPNEPYSVLANHDLDVLTATNNGKKRNFISSTLTWRWGKTGPLNKLTTLVENQSVSSYLLQRDKTQSRRPAHMLTIRSKSHVANHFLLCKLLGKAIWSGPLSRMH